MLKPNINNINDFNDDINAYFSINDTAKNYSISNQKLFLLSLDEIEFSNSIFPLS